MDRFDKALDQHIQDPDMAGNPQREEEDEPVIHYCWVCDVEEECREEKCDYRDRFKCHGYCMGKVKNALLLVEGQNQQ